MDIDSTIMYYFNEVIKPTVTDNNEVVKVPLLNKAALAGVSFIDTARAYGESELEIGNYLVSAKGNHYKVITKLCLSVHQEKRPITITKQLLHNKKLMLFLIKLKP